MFHKTEIMRNQTLSNNYTLQLPMIMSDFGKRSTDDGHPGNIDYYNDK